MMMAMLDEHAVALSLQRALLGAVTPNLRAVSFRIARGTVFVDFVYDGEPGPEETECAQISVSELISDFPHADAIESIRRLDAPEAVPATGGRLVFARREPPQP